MMRNTSLFPLYFPTEPLWALVVAILLSTACLGADFQALPTDQTDIMNPQWNWAMPGDWQNAAKTPGVPSTAQDVGIISKGHRMAVWDPLGTPASLPSIKVEAGGMLYISRDTANPLILAGGVINGDWMGKSVGSPMSVVVDSTVMGRDDAGGWQLHIDGPVSNPAPVTLHTGGMVDWRGDSSRTFTGNISIDRGALAVEGAGGTSRLGTGSILFAPNTFLVLGELPGVVIYPLTNDLLGDGAVWVGNRQPNESLVATGVTLHPGAPDQAGTLSVQGSLSFQRNNGKPAQLIIEVHGDGTNPKANYSQIAVFGTVANTFDNVDLILRIKPDMPADQLAQLHLAVLTVQTPDLTKPDVKPFHSVQVIAGNRTGTATITMKPDSVTGGSFVEVSNISLK